MRRRGVLVSSKKAPAVLVKEENDEDKLASQREWDELEQVAYASKRRRDALEDLQTNRSTLAYDDVDADQPTPAPPVPALVKSVDSQLQDKDSEKSKNDSLKKGRIKDEEMANSADVSEEKRRRLCNAPDDKVPVNDDAKKKKVRGGRKKRKPDKKEKEPREKKTKKKLDDDNDIKADRFKVLEIEGFKKPRRTDTTRLVVYKDFDAPRVLPGGGDFRSQML